MALAGVSARKGAIEGAYVADIAPTILYLLDAPIPRDLEGRVLEEAIDPSLLARRPPAYGDSVPIDFGAPRSYTPAEAQEVEERLRSLGYLG